MTTEPNLIDEANIRKQSTAALLDRAYTLLCEAQDRITDVEGPGSSDVYEEIANAYQSVQALRTKVLAIQPTGLFQ